MAMSRTRNSIKNIIFALIGQILALLISFIARTIFIRILGKEILGLNGLFTNILSMLSFAELGIGSAIIYSMYKPLANNDEKAISSLINLYAKAYNIIGIIILILGITLLPFLKFLVKDYETYTYMNINLIYVLFVINSAITYFYSYKRSIIVANQKKYIDSINRTIFLLLLNVVQLVILYITRNYILYLLIQILFGFLENISISIIANKLYPYLKVNKKLKVDKKEKEEIYTNVKALTVHKIASTFVTSTDNIIISKFIGIVAVGIYSNYFLIINAVKIILNQAFTAITSSVGNLNAVESVEKSESVFKTLYFFSFWVVSLASTLLIVLLNPFITIWLGEEFLFDFYIVAIIVLNFYLYEMRQPLFVYKNTYALFTFDKYVPILEAIINIIASIVLLKFFGIIGVFIGTSLSTLLTCFWVEPLILYKKKFNSNISKFFIKYLKYFMITVFNCIICYYLCINLPLNIIGLILRGVICLIIANTVIILLSYRNKEFKDICNRLKKFIINKNKLERENYE